MKNTAALRRVGKRVRERLAGNQSVYKVPTDKADIWAVGDFLTQEECRKLRDMIDGVARPSSVHPNLEDTSYRTSYSGDIDREDPYVRKLARRIDDLIGLENDWGESIQGQRYMPGQEFKAHVDWFHPDDPYWETEMKRGGQRSITAMAFLNEVEAGGTTDFTALGYSIEPKPGVLLIWNNADEDGMPNEMTRHAGTPVEAGVKYVFTRWYRTEGWH